MYRILPGRPIWVWWRRLVSLVTSPFSDDHVYAVFGEHGLRVIDVSESATPTVVGIWQPGTEATGVAVSGSHAYVSLSNGTLCVIDVSLPSSPANLGSVGQSGSALDVAFDGLGDEFGS